ncbi:MAG: hypothetical protein II955_03635 [Clostridia bacterium]|nr:hypothetical protein [Clostridia bacterium]MBQ3639591.1 hypothetical protein [Clostridia bacterium]
MAISNFIPTVWSEALLQSLGKKYVAVANCNREFEGEIKEKGSSVKVCGVGDVTVSNYTKNTNMSAPETLSDNARELVIDRAKYFNFQIDDIDRAQSLPRLMEAAMTNAAAALANEADQYVYGLYTAAGSTIANTDAAPENVIDTLLSARTRLYKQNVSNADDIVFEVSPEIGEMLLKAKADLATDNSESLEAGCIGKIAGCRVYVSNNIAVTGEDDGDAHHCLARTRRAIAFAEQLSEIDAYRPELRFADAVKGLHLYGARVFYPQEMVHMNFTIAD